MKNKEKELQILEVSINKALELMDAMRTIDDTLDALTYGIFLYVCLNEGTSNDNIITKFVGVHKARISRGIHILCKTSRGRIKQDGDGLLFQKISPEDFRMRSLFLTDKGRSVMNKISKLLK